MTWQRTKFIAFLESQIKGRPIGVSFPIVDENEYNKTFQWLVSTYEYIPQENSWAQEFFIDRATDNDYVIMLNPPGINITVMTYEYYMATR